MATTERTEDSQLDDFSALSINEEPAASEFVENSRNRTSDISEKWGLRLSDLYRLAVQFYRGGWTRCLLLGHLTYSMKRHTNDCLSYYFLKLRLQSSHLVCFSVDGYRGAHQTSILVLVSIFNSIFLECYGSKGPIRTLNLAKLHSSPSHLFV